LETGEEQFRALREITRHLTEGGFYIGTENFIGGQENLNAMRRAVKLEGIPVRWHNLYFDEAEFISRTAEMFSEVNIVNFSSTYYLITRVVYSALCKMQDVAPDYDHPIHTIAADMPAIGDFSPIKLIKARV
jgi:hypothetical protein